jgi:opacity protein-like surface antigen
MKKVLFALLVAVFTLCMGTVSYAKSAVSEGTYGSGAYEFDASLAPATGPGDYDSGVGINFGLGYILAPVDKNLQARFDIAFYEFKHDFPWGSGTYTRVPIIIGVRYYMPIVDKLRAFGQVGLETSIDSFDNSANQNKSDLNIGIAPGAGIEFFVNPKVSVFTLGLAHLISDSYFSMHFGVATHF